MEGTEVTGTGAGVKKQQQQQPESVAHLAAALREAASEPGATLQYPTPGGMSDEQPPGVPLTSANPAADPATHNLIVGPGTSPGQVDVLEQVDVLAPGKGGKELAEALLQAREKAPGALLHGDQPLRDPLATHGSSDESEGPTTTATTSTGAVGQRDTAAPATLSATPTGGAAAASDVISREAPLSPLLPGGPSSAPDDAPSPPAAADAPSSVAAATAEPVVSGAKPGGGGGGGRPESVAHLAAALREAASEPGATLQYPTPGGMSDEQVFRRPPGVPLTAANPAADPATHHLIVGPGTSPGQVDVLEQVDLPPLAKEDGSPVPEAAAVLEQVCEHNPVIGPKPLHDPLAEKGSSDEGEGPLEGPMGGEGPLEGPMGGGAVEGPMETGEPAEVLPLGAGVGAVDALTAAFKAVGLGKAVAGDEGVEGSGGASGGEVGGGGGGSGGGLVQLAAAAEKLRHSAAAVADVVRGSASQADQKARQMAAAVAAGASAAKNKALGGGGGGIVGQAKELLGEALIGGDVITDQDIKEDWTAGPAP
ncbi:hypothetical protein PLESTB_000719400 [Pleodorina starrii]|uniref:Uncharacterized protein n=1 Tax=Pleodorina starrii TaxID=330485 RepID=A0A9W6F1W3_9CHLO|nr:hypothetical protein PLESTB_000719400 [Pleodorina starrii]